MLVHHQMTINQHGVCTFSFLSTNEFVLNLQINVIIAKQLQLANQTPPIALSLFSFPKKVLSTYF